MVCRFGQVDLLRLPKQISGRATLQILLKRRTRGKTTAPGLEHVVTRAPARNIAIVFTLVAVLVALGAGVALAGDQVIQCKKKPCTTTGNFDKVLERVGNRVPDEIIDKGGDDLILANKYTRDKDVVTGG
jgi:hypothetical protein